MKTVPEALSARPAVRQLRGIIGVGVSLVLNSVQVNGETDAIILVLGFIALPFLAATYVLITYYKKLLRKK